MKPDFPVVGHIHSFGVPTIYKVSGETCDCVELTSCQWRVLEEGIHRGERLQFKWKDEMKVRLSMISVIVLNLTTGQGEPRDKFVLGGLHMTDPANLITFMIKELTATETRGYISDEFLENIGGSLDLESLYREQEAIYNLGESSTSD